MYSQVPAHNLLAPVLTAVIQDSGLAPREVNDVIMGNAVGGGGNVARLAALTAGLPTGVPGLTVDRQCASGLDAIVLACRLVEAGAGSWFLAGGVESCSTAPLRAHRLTSAPGAPDFYSRAQFAPENLGDPDAGQAAENVAAHHGINRAQQDAYALRSHARTAASLHLMTPEIVPLEGFGRDQTARKGMTAHLLYRFPPAFDPEGSVTAGNSCADADGAVVALVTSVDSARAAGVERGLVFGGSASTGGEPARFGTAGALAVRILLGRMNLGPDDISRWEFNEAFAAQVLASARLMDVPPERLNLQGGALAYGHPYGASGAMLVANLLRQMEGDDDGGWSVAAISAAGGVGTAAAFRAESL
ncbi:acetyl-CoA C-acyltransferase [Arthrobacter sp. JZ12]|nr:acetyl-CoA C-acyltransferase [Arthrobacter sp. JZ12]